MNLDQWLADVDGKTIGNGQCWGLAEDYSIRVCNGGELYTHPSPHEGYAIGVWDGFESSGVAQFYSKADASQTMLPGWIPIWKWGSPVAPESHIAIGLKDLGYALDCETQNPGSAHRMVIPKLGLAGYLVPKNMGGSTINTAGNITVNNPVSDATNTINQLQGLASFAVNVRNFFNTPGIWQRIGIYIVGALILLMALIYMFKDELMDTVESVVK